MLGRPRQVERAALASMLLASVGLLPPGSPALGQDAGRDAVLAALLRQPAPVGPPSLVVSWEPEYADVSRAGDLGYTSGPAVLTDQSPARKPPRHGTYFTIWRKQADATWKVVLDAGSDGPEGSAGRKAVL